MRILFVSARPPQPARRGDQARLAGWLRALAPRHKIAVLSLVPSGFPVAPLAKSVHFRSVPHGRAAMVSGMLRGPGLPIQVAMHRSTALGRAFDRTLERFEPDVVVPVLSRVGWVADRTHGIPVVLDLVDSLARNLERRARRQPWARPLLLWEAARMRAWDQQLIRRAVATCVVSEDDRQAVVAGAPELASRVTVVPFGLEVPDTLPGRPAGGAPIVLLSGNLGYFPTVDAARTFASNVWPAIRAAVPDAVWWLAGARPARALRRLAELAGVRIIPDPPDLAALRQQATIAIAPLRSGSGTPIKILEAMADGLPVVTTPSGARGLDGVRQNAITIADRAADQAEAVVRLLRDPDARKRQAALAFDWVRARHDLRHIGRGMEQLLEAAVG